MNRMFACPHCGRQFANVSSHISKNLNCALALSRTRPPDVIDTSPPAMIDTVANEPQDDPTSSFLGISPSHDNNNISSRRKSTRVRKQVVPNPTPHQAVLEEDHVPSPDLSLVDYVATFTEESTPTHPIHNPGNSGFVNPSDNPSSVVPNNTQMLEEVWQNNFSWDMEVDLHTIDTINATAPNPNPNSDGEAPSDGESPSPSNHSQTSHTIGCRQSFYLPIDVQHTHNVYLPHDRTMAGLYFMCDKARTPSYLADQIIGYLKEQTINNHFNLLSTPITSRDAMMHRLQKGSGLSHPEAIPITLESGRKTTVFRFNFLEQFQRHLLSKPFSVMGNLVTDPDNPWHAKKGSSEFLDLLDGEWSRRTWNDFVSHHKDDIDDFCYHPVSLYVDKTGTDRLERNALEPLVMTSSCPETKCPRRCIIIFRSWIYSKS